MANLHFIAIKLNLFAKISNAFYAALRQFDGISSPIPKGIVLFRASDYQAFREKRD